MSAAIAILRPPISTVNTPANTVLLHLGPGAAAFAAYVGLNATDRSCSSPSSTVTEVGCPAMRSVPIAAGNRRSTPTQLIKRSNNLRR